MSFPITRLRRLRSTEALRSMIRETSLSVSDFVYPLFVVHGNKVKEEIKSMPGQYRMSVDVLVEECRKIYDMGIPSVMLFGIPEYKDALGTESYSDNGIVQQAIRELSSKVPGLLVVADVCLCEYTDHGHCGVIEHNDVNNDKTLDLLTKQSVSYAKAGVGMIAPSDMMDGRVEAIRQALDNNGFSNIPIMAYSAKYASGFYGPFREAADSAPQFGDRRSYQMDPANSNEAMREIELDIVEGADIIMVKPALSYLDIIRRAKDEFNLPIAAYNVSGEYSMVKAAAANGWIDGDRVMMESLLSIKRAGADIIISYFAPEVAALLK
ncbi:MAG: porphobilinogen synthase [Bacteroidota bacterium]|nr:porphobilinogen synthase [Bacteroidota bacterium]